ncbi:MAG: phosphonate C-P lyase system protein PhnG [Acidimicrobiaceae bacterium]|nr:phosphonate C-P lyase system protein PhnG [Acidimicrobiaceae bacterium]
MAPQQIMQDLTASDGARFLAEGRTREWRSEQLAFAEVSALVGLADRCLAGGGTRLSGEPVVGTVSLCVREPVVGERFLLADVLATRAEVDHRGVRGWAMRLGDDKEAAVAAAICDAEASTGTGLSDEIDALCAETERRRRELDGAEWAELAATEVHFEELDR